MCFASRSLHPGARNERPLQLLLCACRRVLNRLTLLLANPLRLSPSPTTDRAFIVICARSLSTAPRCPHARQTNGSGGTPLPQLPELMETSFPGTFGHLTGLPPLEFERETPFPSLELPPRWASRPPHLRSMAHTFSDTRGQKEVPTLQANPNVLASHIKAANSASRSLSAARNTVVLQWRACRRQHSLFW